MNKHILGLLTPIVVTVLLISISVLLAYITGSISNDGWAALGIIIISLLIFIVVQGISLIVGLYLHFKKQNEYGKGLLNGTLIVLAVGIIGFVMIGIFG